MHKGEAEPPSMIYNMIVVVSVIIFVIITLNVAVSGYHIFHEYYSNVEKVSDHIDHSKEYIKRDHCKDGSLRYKDNKFGYTDCEKAEENSKKDPYVTARLKTWEESIFSKLIKSTGKHTKEILIFGKFIFVIIFVVLVWLAIKWVSSNIDANNDMRNMRRFFVATHAMNNPKQNKQW